MESLYGIIFLLQIATSVLIVPLLFAWASIFLLYTSVKRLFFNKSHKIKKKSFVIAIAILFCTPLYYLFSVIFFNNVLCANEELPKVTSLSGKYYAQVKSKNCGATTGYSTWTEITEINGKKYSIFFYSGHPKDLELQWLSDTKLQISYTNPKCSVLGRAGPYVKPGETTWNAIAIDYIDKCPKD